MSNIDDTIKLLGILFGAWAVSQYMFVKGLKESIMLQLPSRISGNFPALARQVALHLLTSSMPNQLILPPFSLAGSGVPAPTPDACSSTTRCGYA
ncbi:hypothetical protein CVT26_007861 [Gymnopilus dilepis]|uniref:Uncharacterized protein n=1 Tax=Gymnopilus dilepis TaxID=231916 RepID=A0A409YKA3_9AGAR|nr:hypothetical protein CVT26_007861 [Gymnopilus dilepis]